MDRTAFRRYVEYNRILLENSKEKVCIYSVTIIYNILSMSEFECVVRFLVIEI